MLPAILALIIQPSGEYQARKIEQNLQTLQSIVGGYLQAVPTLFDQDGNPQAMVWCNDDGKNIGLESNPAATILWWVTDPTMRGQDILHGTAFFTGPPDQQSDITSVPEAVIREWEALNDATNP